jgi:hypothetical protein
VNTTPFDIFVEELPEGPEWKYWFALDGPSLDMVA